MTFSIIFGWWLAPALVTIAAFAWSTHHQDHRPTGDYGRIGQGIGNAILHGVALIVSLIVWLVWALAT